MLKTPNYWSCILLKTPLVNMKKKASTAISFFILFTLTYLVLFFMIFPNLEKGDYYFVAISGGYLLLFIAWLRASLADPGHLKQTDLSFLSLLDKFPATSLCPDCKVIRTSRSRHSSICN